MQTRVIPVIVAAYLSAPTPGHYHVGDHQVEGTGVAGGDLRRRSPSSASRIV
jgi:hypothetical protein